MKIKTFVHIHVHLTCNTLVLLKQKRVVQFPLLELLTNILSSNKIVAYVYIMYTILKLHYFLLQSVPVMLVTSFYLFCHYGCVLACSTFLCDTLENNMFLTEKEHLKNLGYIVFGYLLRTKCKNFGCFYCCSN